MGFNRGEIRIKATNISIMDRKGGKCTLVHSLIVSRVDYCNSLYLGLPNHLLKKLQSIMNKSARLIFSVAPRVPTTRFLIKLHWLPIKARIEFKICLVVFKALKVWSA